MTTISTVIQSQSAPPSKLPHSSREPLLFKPVWGDWQAPLLVSLFALVLRLIDHKSFFYDEFFSLSMARTDWSTFFHLIRVREANMALYYVALHFWCHLGTSALLLRFPSILLGAGSVLLTFMLGRLLFGPKAALLASVLLALNPFHILYSQELRSYSLLVFLTTLSTIVFIALIEGKGKRSHWVAYGLLAGAATYVHIFAFLIPVSHALSLLARPRGTIPWRTLLRGYIMAFAVASLMLAYIVKNFRAQQIGWVPKVGFTQLPQMIRALSGDGGNFLMVLFLLALLAALVATFRNKDGDRWRIALAWSLFAAPLIIVLAMSFKRSLFIPRFLIIVLVPMTLLVAFGMSALEKKWIRWSAAFLVLGATVITLPAYYQWEGYNDWKSTARFIMDHSREGDVIVFNEPFLIPDYKYYASGGPQVVAPVMKDAEFWVGHELSKDLQLMQAARTSPRVWLVEVDEPVTDADKLAYHFGTSVPWTMGPNQETSRFSVVSRVDGSKAAGELGQSFPYVYVKRFAGLRVFLFSRSGCL